ncbi:MAG: ABC transporter substrate-binding protein, partial [Oscillospiraceae bacterium]
KTIYSTGKGTTPEYVLNYVLQQNGLDPQKDVTIEYKAEASEIAALLSEGQQGIAMLPQPYVTTVMSKMPNLRVALDMTAEWDRVAKGESNLVTGVLVVRRAFAEQNQDALNAFLKEYKDSVAFVNSNVDVAAELVAKQGIVPSAAIAKQAIPACNITLIDGDEMQTKAGGYLQVLFEQNPASVGGKLPDEAFYYKH